MLHYIFEPLTGSVQLEGWAVRTEQLFHRGFARLFWAVHSVYRTVRGTVQPCEGFLAILGQLEPRLGRLEQVAASKIEL